MTTTAGAWQRQSEAPTVLALRIYPTQGAPGVDLEQARVDAAGFAGDRRKKSAVHLVGGPSAQTRANIVLDGSDELVHDLVGRRVIIGAVELAVTGRAGDCPGVYADVLRTGSIHVGDRVEIGPVSGA